MNKHPYLTVDAAYQRLLQEYSTHKSLTVAVDFDNTIYDYHQTEMDCSEVIDLLRKLKSIGFYIIIWTASEDHSFIDEYCNRLNIPYDRINENPPFFAGKARKIYYNELLDDRAGLKESFDRLTKIYNHVTSQPH
jgi:hydroxymethylpyrimidine pyrophosphatase-like HAD family hydrolase